MPTTRDITLVLRDGLADDNQGLTKSLTATIRSAIASGVVTPGDRLPPSRRLARDLGVARGTVTNAVETLIAEGLLETRVGAGTYVAQDASCLLQPGRQVVKPFIRLPVIPKRPDVDLPAKAIVDFRPCRPSVEAFPLKTWRRAMSLANSTKPSADYGDPKGYEPLRKAICDYLRRVRGLPVTSNQIIVTNGAVHAMYMMTVLYPQRGAKVVVENPGYPLVRQMFENAGAKIIPCPVDENGLRVEDLPARIKNVRFVYVTPSHQFPTGSRLSLARRRDLIDWAERKGVIILEDDYDGEFRYDVPPLAPMAAMDNACVVYCGTFSKTMFPGIRIGFAVGPPALIEAMAALRTFSEYAPNETTQRALTHFIEDAQYERHIHRMRRLYASKRQVLAEAIDSFGSGAQITGLDSGLNATIILPKGVQGKTVSRDAAKRGILIPSITRYAVDKTIADRAVVLGYAVPTPTQIEQGLRLLF